MYRVLLADDEQIERMALARRLMRRFGDILQISEATNGKEAVQLYEKERQPDHYHGYFHAGIKWCRSGREDPQHG